MDSSAALLHDAHRGLERTLPELAVDLGLSDKDPFQVATEVAEKLASLGLGLEPPITRGEFEERRVLYVLREEDAVLARAELCKPESSRLEFKSTFLFDIRQAKSRDVANVSELSPEIPQQAVLKTICGFLNADGGVLYVGVEDNCAIFGLEKDFEWLGADGCFDKWELRLRSLVESKILDGRMVQRYLRVREISLEGKSVGRVQVARRTRESFLCARHRCEFYLRVGNRTNRIEIQDLPEVILERRGFM